MRLDPAHFPVRRDLASVELADRIFAPHYAQPVRYRVIVPGSVRSEPDGDSEVVGQLKLGGGFDVLDVSGGWAWGQGSVGGPVGYVSVDCLAHP